MFKFGLTIATSVFLLMSGAADLYAMDPDDDNKTNTHYVSSDAMGVILKEASKESNPRHLTSVCKFWYSVIRENQVPQEKLKYSTMNPFMQTCMNTYWESLFYNGILQYTPTNITLKFSDLNEGGTFDLSACGTTGQYFVITTNMDRFFKIEGENKDKAVILITPRYLVEQRITTSPTHPVVAALMADRDLGDPDKAPVGMFWRWGNDKNLASVDSLTTEGMKSISSRNLYENWREALCPQWIHVPLWMREPRGAEFSCQFLNRNKY